MADQKRFCVSWEIDTYAESPEEAVQKAISMYLKPEEPGLWSYGVKVEGSKEQISIEGEDIAWPDNLLA